MFKRKDVTWLCTNFKYLILTTIYIKTSTVFTRETITTIINPMTTLPAKHLALSRIRTGRDFLAAEVGKAGPVARKKNKKYRHKHKQNYKDDDSVHRKLHALSLCTKTHKNNDTTKFISVF